MRTETEIRERIAQLEREYVTDADPFHSIVNGHVYAQITALEWVLGKVS